MLPRRSLRPVSSKEELVITQVIRKLRRGRPDDTTDSRGKIASDEGTT